MTNNNGREDQAQGFGFPNVERFEGLTFDERKELVLQLITTSTARKLGYAISELLEYVIFFSRIILDVEARNKLFQAHSLSLALKRFMTGKGREDLWNMFGIPADCEAIHKSLEYLHDTVTYYSVDIDLDRNIRTKLLNIKQLAELIYMLYACKSEEKAES